MHRNLSKFKLKYQKSLMTGLSGPPLCSCIAQASFPLRCLCPFPLSFSKSQLPSEGLPVVGCGIFCRLHLLVRVPLLLRPLRWTSKCP